MGLKNSYPLRPSPTIPSSSSPSILNGIDYHHHHVDRKYAQVLQNINETRSTPSKTREPNGDTLKPFGTAVSDIITNTSGNKAGQNNHPNIPRSEGVKKSEHVTQKPHQCDQCHLKFTCAGNLNRHKRVTHEMKRILCQYPSCTQTFSQTADRTRHHLRVHKWDGPIDQQPSSIKTAAGKKKTQHASKQKK